MDDAEIVAAVLARDVLRREAQLPPLDVELEIAKDRRIKAGRAADDRYEALCYTHAKERQDIRATVIREAREKGDPGYPNGWSGHFGLHMEIERRFKTFLSSIDQHLRS